jgi:hypothetical protein
VKKARYDLVVERDGRGKLSMSGTNNGFSARELEIVLLRKLIDVVEQIQGKHPPKVVTTPIKHKRVVIQKETSKQKGLK